jgi:hypothetical protein
MLDAGCWVLDAGFWMPRRDLPPSSTDWQLEDY